MKELSLSKNRKSHLTTQTQMMKILKKVKKQNLVTQKKDEEECIENEKKKMTKKRQASRPLFLEKLVKCPL
jgi:hypothetical protein